MNRFKSILLTLIVAVLCAGPGFAQIANLKVVSGNGQIICPLCVSNPLGFYQPLVVRAVDNSGNPVPFATVNWAITSGSFGTLFSESGASTYQATADANGFSQAHFVGFNSITGNPFQSAAQSTITANAGANTVTFYEVQALQDPLNTNFPPITAYGIPVGTLLPGLPFSGQIGTKSSSSIKVQVVGQNQIGIPNVAVSLLNHQGPVATDLTPIGPTATCDTSNNTIDAGPGVVFTDQNGIATCTPVFGGVPGTGSFVVDVGGVIQSDPNLASQAYIVLPSAGGLNLTVTPGIPGSIKLVSGNAQSGVAGQQLANPLVVEVDSSTGAPLGGIGVNWQVTPANSATLGNLVTTSDGNGRVTNPIQFSGAANGTITVKASLASDATKSVTFTLTASPLVTLTSFTIVSGNNQSAIPNAAFPQALVVQANSTAGPAANVAVQFQVISGSAILSATSATTDASGRAQITASAGSNQGPVVVQASIPGAGALANLNFNLTVLPPGPTITAANFVNGADFQPNSLSPCSVGAIVTPAGTLGVTNFLSTFPGLPIPPSSNIKLSMNGVSAPILAIGQTPTGQQAVLFQVPCEVTPGGSVPAVLNIGGGTATVNLNVQAASPGIFKTVMSDGGARALMVRPDGSFVSLENPARRGETEVVYVTGLGPATQSVKTTSLPFPGVASPVSGQVVVGMAGGGIPLTYAQLSEDLPGVYRVAFQIPTDMQTGNDVTFSIGLIPVGSQTPIYSGTTTVPVQ